MSDRDQRGDRPIKLPLPPGKVIVFDTVNGKVYVADSRPGPWGSAA